MVIVSSVASEISLALVVAGNQGSNEGMKALPE